jgi:hypothetical protein
MSTTHAQTTQFGYELRFRSLFHEGRGYSFACDAAGHVNLDDLSMRLRDKYLYVRALVGREFTAPAVVPVLDAALAAALGS